jgi:PAS domain-containing protein
MVLVHGLTPDGLPGPILEVNNLICERLGQTRERLLSMTVLDLEVGHTPYAKAPYTGADLLTFSDKEIAERDRLFAGRDTRILMRQILNDRIVQYERVLATKTGAHIPVEVTAHCIDHAGGTLIVYTAHDITSRRRTEQALRESEQRFRDVFDTSPIGVAIYNAGRKLVSVNPACLKLFGAPAATISPASTYSTILSSRVRRAAPSIAAKPCGSRR